MEFIFYSQDKNGVQCSIFIIFYIFFKFPVINSMGALPRVPLSRDTHGPASNAAAVLAAVNSNSMLNPLLGSLVDPRACASALVNAAHGSYPDVLLQNNQVSS